MKHHRANRVLTATNARAADAHEGTSRHTRNLIAHYSHKWFPHRIVVVVVVFVDFDSISLGNDAEDDRINDDACNAQNPREITGCTFSCCV